MKPTLTNAQFSGFRLLNLLDLKKKKKKKKKDKPFKYIYINAFLLSLKFKEPRVKHSAQSCNEDRMRETHKGM